MSQSVVKIKDVCEFVRGLTYSKSDEVEYSNNAVLRATNIDLNSNRLNLTEIRYIADSVNVKADKKIRVNDILICTASGSKSHLGKVAFIEEKIDMAFGGFMGVLRAKPNINPKYLFAFFKSEIFVEHVFNIGDGANINNLKFSQFEDLEIVLPSLPVQQKIVNKLDSIFAEIDKAKQSAEKNTKNAEALFQSYLKEIFFSENQKSNGVPLDSLCDFLNGYAFKSTDSIESSNTQLLRMGNLYGNILDLERSPVFYPNSFKNIYSKFVLNVGDIVVSLTGTVGKRDYGYAIKVPDSSVDLLLNQRLLKIHNLDISRVNYEYFNFYLHSLLFLDELYKSANGTRQANLSSEYIKKMKIPLCTISEQLTYVKSLMSLKESCESLRETSFEKTKSLMLLKQSILKQAFNGELVKE